MKKITKSVISYILSCFIAVAASGCTHQNDELYKANAYTEFIDSSVAEFASEQPKAAAQKHTTASIKEEKNQPAKVFRCLTFPNIQARHMQS